MTLEPERLAAVFSLSPTSAGMSLQDVLRMAGAMDIQSLDDGSTNTVGRVACMWADMSCEAGPLSARTGLSVAIWFWQSEFLDRLPEDDTPLSGADETDRIADAFRQACERLRPDVAFMAMHLDQATPDRLQALAEQRDPNYLADQRLGLLYVSEPLGRAWTPDPVRDNRDRLAVGRGRLVFAGRGRMRWF